MNKTTTKSKPRSGFVDRLVRPILATILVPTIPAILMIIAWREIMPTGKEPLWQCALGWMIVWIAIEIYQWLDKKFPRWPNAQGHEPAPREETQNGN